MKSSFWLAIYKLKAENVLIWAIHLAHFNKLSGLVELSDTDSVVLSSVDQNQYHWFGLIQIERSKIDLESFRRFST